MKHLQPLIYGIDVSEILRELEAHPELWNQYTLRTSGYAPVHNQVSDIWVRYRAWSDWEASATENLAIVPDQIRVARFVGEEHDSTNYPAWYCLPELRSRIFRFMDLFEVERLGGVLITRIPPGGEVKPHIDRGWHAGYYEKIALQLKSSPGQRFCFADGGFECEPGTAYAFDNSFEHWVENPTQQERITCIICVRRDQTLRPLHSGPGG